MAFYKDLRLVLIAILCLCTALDESEGFLVENNCFVSPPCTCSPDPVNCSGRGLVNMPKFQPYNITGGVLSFDMDRNNLTVINDNAFSNISCFNESNFYVFLQDNLISELSDDCFNGIEDCLFQITLSNNQLTTLPRALRSLTRLRHLVLDGNPLTTLDSYTMSVIGRNLWTLDISLSHFTSWPRELHFLRQLQMLMLHSIPFTSLPHNAFQGFEDTLTWLSIINSNLIELPVSICDLSKLYRLEFIENQHLFGNSLYVDACFNLMQINDTTFLNNSLVRFPVLPGNGTFYPRLDLSYNNIRVIQDTSIHGHRIKELILDHNRLFRIPYALNYIQDLEHLDLRNNNIISIEDPDLEKLSNLTQLQLDFNQILFISNRAFVSNIKLLYLYLTNNNLKTIPPAFLSLKNIFWIHLDHNDIDCTCSDLDFGTLNASQTIRIEGNCKYGTETLKSFIASNPPTCS